MMTFATKCLCRLILIKSCIAKNPTAKCVMRPFLFKFLLPEEASFSLLSAEYFENSVTSANITINQKRCFFCYINFCIKSAKNKIF